MKLCSDQNGGGGVRQNMSKAKRKNKRVRTEERNVSNIQPNHYTTQKLAFLIDELDRVSVIENIAKSGTKIRKV